METITNGYPHVSRPTKRHRPTRFENFLIELRSSPIPAASNGAELVHGRALEGGQAEGFLDGR